MYQDKFKAFKNIKNLAGKAWEHAVAIDLLNDTDIEDCSIHCFHYQQMLALLFQHILETKSAFASSVHDKNYNTLILLYKSG